jgi:hypothetical protein
MRYFHKTQKKNANTTHKYCKIIAENAQILQKYCVKRTNNAQILQKYCVKRTNICGNPIKNAQMLRKKRKKADKTEKDKTESNSRGTPARALPRSRSVQRTTSSTPRHTSSGERGTGSELLSKVKSAMRTYRPAPVGLDFPAGWLHFHSAWRNRVSSGSGSGRLARVLRSAQCFSCKSKKDLPVTATSVPKTPTASSAPHRPPVCSLAHTHTRARARAPATHEFAASDVNLA